METKRSRTLILLALALVVASAQEQSLSQQADVILPEAVAPGSQPPTPEPANPAVTREGSLAGTPSLAPLAECPQLDEVMKQEYDPFFLLTR